MDEANVSSIPFFGIRKLARQLLGEVNELRFGERMVKIGLTRRLDPHERIRELGDASVPFNFDVHALFFSKDAVGIEAALHERLSGHRVNIINRRREFFHVTPGEVKVHLSALAGELLTFQDVAEALEYRQSLAAAASPTVPSAH